MSPPAVRRTGRIARVATTRLGRQALLVWDRMPGLLCFALLAAQMALPWMVRNFVTQDGPSHLYGGTIFRELLFHHRGSIYSPLYTIQRALLPNWITTVVLAGFSALAGPACAEKLFASFAIAVGVFAFASAVRSLYPDAPPWTPVANFLLNVWFLWMGFYNFYLGMALLPFAIAVYARRGVVLTWRRAAALSAILVLLFFTHLVPAIVATMAVISLALWRALWEPRDRFRGILIAAAATAPAVLLVAAYAHGAGEHPALVSEVASAWHRFPMHVFATTAGDAGAQRATWHFLLGYLALAACLMKRTEWRSPRGGLAAAIVLTFLMYLLVPDHGFGGNEAKIRFAWAVFVLSGLFACSVSRLRRLRPVAAICIAWWIGWNLLASYRTAQNVDRAAGQYRIAASAIPSGASFVRLRYAAPSLPERFGYAGIGRDPLLHLDAFAAVQAHAIDLSDYEASNPIFPVVYKKTVVDPGQQSSLWAFEGPDPASLDSLVWLDNGLPRPIGYVLVLGEPGAAESIRAGMPAMLRYLNANLTPVAESLGGTLRLYRRDRRLPAR